MYWFQKETQGLGGLLLPRGSGRRGRSCWTEPVFKRRWREARGRRQVAGASGRSFYSSPGRGCSGLPSWTCGGCNQGLGDETVTKTGGGWQRERVRALPP